MQREALAPLIGVCALMLCATLGALGIVSSGANTVNSEQASGALLPPKAASHISCPSSTEEFTRAPESVQQNQATAVVVSAPSTRSSFMASWGVANGATGYRLDVSTAPDFASYVEGYHDLDVGAATGRVVTGLESGATYYYRVRAYGAGGATSANSAVRSETTAQAGAGLTINATFDSSITNNANAAQIEAAVNRAIAIEEALFSDRVTIPILFRYATTGPGGSSLGLAESDFPVYPTAWNSWVSALRADTKDSNDSVAVASLPSYPLSNYIDVTSANGRAIGLDTPPSMDANGNVGNGPYDGIVTLNSSQPFRFTRPAVDGYYDAQASIEHEIDEIMAIGSNAGSSGDLQPEDVFTRSAPGTRNHTKNGTRYFSINGGNTNIVTLNQDPNGDFGDWQSGPCPQTTPYVQNAFGCTGQSSDISASSPEGIMLDIIGYDSPTPQAPRAVLADVNSDGNPDYVLYDTSSRRTAVWYLNNNALLAGAYGPIIPGGWTLIGTADFNGDGHPDYVLFNASTWQTAIWYMSGATVLGAVYGPTLPPGWQLSAVADFNNDGHPDYLLYNSHTHQTAQWYLDGTNLISATYSGALPLGWSVVGTADFDSDGYRDYLLYNPSTRQSAIWYYSGANFTGGQYGPTIASGYELVGTVDFNHDGHPDLLLYAPSTGRTAIWYMNNATMVSGAYGPTFPAGWSWPAQ
jgi:hypothetical protein